jgi:hypothetical protein
MPHSETLQAGDNAVEPHLRCGVPAKPRVIWRKQVCKDAVWQGRARRRFQMLLETRSRKTVRLLVKKRSASSLEHRSVKTVRIRLQRRGLELQVVY